MSSPSLHFGSSPPQADPELVRVGAELARVQEELSRFVYAASHDLQEPLRMVTTFLGMLKRHLGPQLDDNSQRYMDLAMDGVERMYAEIQGLLEYSRAHSNALAPERLQSTEPLERALEALHKELDTQHAVVTHAELPTVEADPVQLQHVFRHLIQNALRYRGAEEPHVHVSCAPDADRYVFQVHDNGIGFDMEYAEKIFEPFRRLHTQQEIPGAGLGLAVCRKILHRHHGDIWAKARPGKGASFYFSLPMV